MLLQKLTAYVKKIYLNKENFILLRLLPCLYFAIESWDVNTAVAN